MDREFAYLAAKADPATLRAAKERVQRLSKEQKRRSLERR